MAYDLMFGGEFFYAAGEPYDRSNYAVDEKGRPISLYSAICMALDDDKERARIEDELEWNHRTPATYNKWFKIGDKIPITPEIVMEACEKVDTCGTLTVPVDVWMVKGGWYTFDVWDGPEKKED
jgi:hypothetical protein